MPLRDHFHPPLRNRRHAEGLHPTWIITLIQGLVGKLPPRYFAEPEVHLGVQVEPDVATFEEAERRPQSGDGGNGAIATAVYAAAPPSRTCEVDTPARDVYEIRVFDQERNARLVAVVEMVSERNKDRPDARRDFAAKCASYLQQQVSVVVIDVVTSRHGDLYGELLSVLSQERGEEWPVDPPLYAVALRMRRPKDRWLMDAWEEPLRIGGALPTLPLWLASDLVVPLELEATYEEACRVLRIA